LLKESGSREGVIRLASASLFFEDAQPHIAVGFDDSKNDKKTNRRGQMLALGAALPLIVWTMWVFIVGACVGSLLNVCIARLPFEKSILWPMGSRCMTCMQAIRWYDNIPLVSYLVLRGRCRKCRATFSSRYFFVELLTALAFVAVFWCEAAANLRGSLYLTRQAQAIQSGMIPLPVWLMVIQRWVLLAFLIIVTTTDIQSREIPLGVTITGTLIGLVFSTFMPWPWPEDLNVAPEGNAPWWLLMPPASVPGGAQLWPFWGPQLVGLPFERFWTGLATGIVGMLVGTFLLRGIRFLASRGLGREALGLGDADMMMMVGAFLGWQAVIAAFFVGALVALVIAIIQVTVFRDDSLPFGPGLAVGTVLTWTFWHKIGPAIQPLLFNGQLLWVVFGFGGVLLFVLCWIMGKIRGPVAD
jgi:leader peptidase (prepilin peptidase) / N-methyltransferase